MKDKINKYISDVGRAGLNTLFPDDFEYYAVTLELADSKGKTVEYLTFPISPDSVSYDDQTLANIKKSFGGISVTDSDTLRPKKITLSGTFGRKFKLLVSLNNSKKGSGGIQSGLQLKSSSLSVKLKTGYGTTKILKRIVDESSKLDDYNSVRLLYLYFPILGESYLIKANSLRLTQDVASSNMLWKYNLDLTVLAKLSEIRPEGGAGSKIGNAIVQRGVNMLLNKVKSLL